MSAAAWDDAALPGRTHVEAERVASIEATILTHGAPLATALDGVFEVPDSAATWQWRVAQRFAVARGVIALSAPPPKKCGAHPAAL